MQNKIKTLLEKKGISARKLADDIGVTRQTVYNWMRSSTIPRYGSSLEKLAAYFGVPSVYLLTNEAVEMESVETDDNYVLVPHLEASASCGFGFINSDFLPLVKMIKVSIEWLRMHAPSANLRRLNIVVAEGDSMLPTIKSGDMVMIDRSQTEARFDGLYVFVYDDELFIKRLQKIPRGFSVISDNPTYRTFDVLDSEIERLRIVGKVVSIGKFENQ